MMGGSWIQEDAIYDGDRIAQLLFNVPVELQQVDELTPTERGNGGFGSTGRTDTTETKGSETMEMLMKALIFGLY